MITTELYNGQGFGNQLWVYIVTRVIANNNKNTFGIQNPSKWKGGDLFLNIDFGLPVIGGLGLEGGIPKILPDGIKYYYREHELIHPNYKVDIRTYDQNLISIPDNTKIDGLMQDEKYIIHMRNEIREWLTINPKYNCSNYLNENICVINFRGGEYTRNKDVFLPKKYWEDAVKNMRKINPDFTFIVVTDDRKTAKKFFPNFKIFHDNIGNDYSMIHFAHYLILSNSSFAFFPAWTNKTLKYCIAPKYWAAHNISDGFWSLDYNITNEWHYQDKQGVIFDYEACLKEQEEYKLKNKDYFLQPSIKDSFLVVSNYYNNISWVPEYTDDYLIYDQSAESIYPPKLEKNKVIKSEHKGHNIRDYCTFIIDHYDNLPETTIFVAGNVFPRHVSQYYFNTILNKKTFTPIEEPNKHKAFWPISFISKDGGYNEYNNSWYLKHHPKKYFHSYEDFINFCFKNPPISEYIRFATGANYIVPKKNILKLPKVFYENLRIFVSYTEKAIPGEAHIIERALYTLWNNESELEINENMLNFLGENFQGIPKKYPKFSFKRIMRTFQIKIISLYRIIIKRSKYIIEKLPSLFQYFNGKRDIKTLWTRKEFHKIQYIMQKIKSIKIKILSISNITLSLIQSFLFTLFQKKKTTEEILTYRKKIKIYDIFSLFNELDILEIRLNILDPYVDYFVIIESNKTFSGLPKPFYYEENRGRFSKWEHKIIYSKIVDMPDSMTELQSRLNNGNITKSEQEIIHNTLKSKNIPKGQANWIRDFYQKEYAQKVLTELSDDDICFVSDIDEIWNPDIYIDYTKNYIYKLEQKVYTYYLNNRSNEYWIPSFVTKYKNIKHKCLNHIRSDMKANYIILKNAGWHFTNQGGLEKLKEKVISYSHQEFNTEDIKSQIEKRREENTDFAGRKKFKFWLDESELPEYIIKNKNKYKELFKK